MLRVEINKQKTIMENPYQNYMLPSYLISHEKLLLFTQIAEPQILLCTMSQLLSCLTQKCWSLRFNLKYFLYLVIGGWY